MKIILALFFALVLGYIWTDRQLYFYGKSDLEIYNPLPIGVKPEYWGYDLGSIGFVLIDDFDFVVAGKGTKYRNSEVIVDDIIRYGFDKRKIVVKVIDSLGNEHIIRLQSPDESDIEATVDATVDQSRLTWVEIKGKDTMTRTLEWTRSLIRIGLFILIVVIGVRTIRALLRRMNRPTTTTK